MDRENVVKALEDSYRYSNVEEGCTLVLQDVVLSAISLLKEQEDLGTELTNAVELIHKKNGFMEKMKQV